MICYRDKTFCTKADECGTIPCSARFTKEDEFKAKQWWGNDNYPVACADLSNECKSYTPKDNK